MIKLIRSFKFAFFGIWTCIKNERNFRVHIVAAIAVFIFSCIYQIPKVNTLVLILTIFLVITMEALNTSIETVVDLASPEKSELAKAAKDTAAAAVLLAAICAVVVAFLTFSDLSRLKYTFMQLIKMPNLIFTILFVATAALFVFGISDKKIDKKNKIFN